MSSDVGLTYEGQTVIITTIHDDDVGLHVLGAYYRPKRGPFITLHSLLVGEWRGGGGGEGGGRGLGEGLICSAYVMVGRPLGKLQVYLHS